MWEYEVGRLGVRILIMFGPGPEAAGTATCGDGELEKSIYDRFCLLYSVVVTNGKVWFWE